MGTRTLPELLQQRWRRLAQWPRRLLVIAAVLVGTSWITIGSVVLLALADSALGCLPTMGCRELQTNDCPAWSAFMQPASVVSLPDNPSSSPSFAPLRCDNPDRKGPSGEVRSIAKDRGGFDSRAVVGRPAGGLCCGIGKQWSKGA